MTAGPVLTLRFVGTGDAFGTGGRFHTCLHVSDGTRQALIDCGASAVSALKREGVDPASLDVILISHLHGDHFGGVPFLLLEARFAQPRKRPLVIAGPPGIEARVWDTLEQLFPGSGRTVRSRVATRFIEYQLGAENDVDGLAVLPLEVVHPSGAPSCGLRLTWHDRVVAFSGDTEWTPALVTLAREADLFICECYSFDKAVPYHLSHEALTTHADELRPRRLVLTHPGATMLARVAESRFELAFDGLVLTL